MGNTCLMSIQALSWSLPALKHRRELDDESPIVRSLASIGNGPLGYGGAS
jgi:hypothetical protein